MNLEELREKLADVLEFIFEELDPNEQPDVWVLGMFGITKRQFDFIFKNRQ